MKIISLLDNTIKINVEKLRPPEDIRSQLDIGYSFEKNNLILFEIRPNFMDETKIMNIEFAKARFYKSQEIWKIYWKRGNGNWELYRTPEVTAVERVFEIIEEDVHGCFFG